MGKLGYTLEFMLRNQHGKKTEKRFSVQVHIVQVY